MTIGLGANMRKLLYSLTPKINRFFTRTETKPILGRWSIVTEEKLYRRSDRSNEDHCGPCGEYVLQRWTQKEHEKAKKV